MPSAPQCAGFADHSDGAESKLVVPVVDRLCACAPGSEQYHALCGDGDLLIRSEAQVKEWLLQPSACDQDEHSVAGQLQAYEDLALGDGRLVTIDAWDQHFLDPIIAQDAISPEPETPNSENAGMGSAQPRRRSKRRAAFGGDTPAGKKRK